MKTKSAIPCSHPRRDQTRDQTNSKKGVQKLPEVSREINRLDMAQYHTLEELPEEVPEDLIQEIDQVSKRIKLACYRKTGKGVIKFKEFPPFDDVLREQGIAQEFMNSVNNHEKRENEIIETATSLLEDMEGPAIVETMGQEIVATKLNDGLSVIQ